MRHSLFYLLIAGSGMATFACHAGKVTVERLMLDEGNTVAQLEGTSQYYVDAMRNLIADRYPGEYRARRWEELETAMRDTPVARLEYHYQREGRSIVRVYHAMGGRPLGAMAERIFEGNTPPSTPTNERQQESSWSDVDESEEDIAGAATDVQDVVGAANMAEDDATQSKYYDDLADGEVRASIRPNERTALVSFDAYDRKGVLEAEYKALRALEDDILDGMVPAGGTVRGVVADGACSSCRYAMDSMARVYDIDIHLVQVFGAVAEDERRRLIDSGRARMKGLMLVDVESGRPVGAHDALYGARSTQVRVHLSPRAMNSSFRGFLRQRSFRLPVPNLSRVSEGSSSGASPARPSGDPSSGSSPEC